MSDKEGKGEPPPEPQSYTTFVNQERRERLLRQQTSGTAAGAAAVQLKERRVQDAREKFATGQLTGGATHATVGGRAAADPAQARRSAAVQRRRKQLLRQGKLRLQLRLQNLVLNLLLLPLPLSLAPSLPLQLQNLLLNLPQHRPLKLH